MNEYESIKQVPYSPEAEQAVLGGILVDNEEFSRVAQKLKSDDFYYDRHKDIFSVMQEMYIESKKIDYITVIDKLAKNGVYTKEEGMQYIKKLADSVPSISNLDEYVKIVLDNSMLRKLIKVANEIAESAYTPQGDAEKIVDSAEQKIFEIAQNNVKGDFSHIRDVIVNNFNHLQTIIDDPEGSTGIKTRYSELDRWLVGLGEGDLVFIGARPGMGKTSFALNIAENVAKGTKKAVAVFSLEMSNEQLVLRMLSGSAMINNYKLRTGDLSPEDWSMLSKAGSALSECEIYIDDTSNVTPNMMKAKLRRVKDLGLVIVDYLQLVRSDKPNSNRVQEMSDITRGLKLMAKDLRVPVICAAQLSRDSEKRQGGHRPQLSDLRDSGSIEQDADIVMFIYRDEYYKKQGEENASNVDDNVAEISIAKNRHGSTGTVKMCWYGQYYRFIASTDEYDDVGEQQ